MRTAVLRSIPVVVLAAVAMVFLGGSSSSDAQGRPVGFTLPAHAAEVAPGIFYLGTTIDNGIPVEGYAYAHHREGHSGGPGGGGDPTPEPTPDPGDTSSCYSFIANGASWRVAENVTIDATSNPDLGVTLGQIQGWMEAWEDQSAASGIYGSFGPGSGLVADTTSTDGQNEVYFAPIADSNVLGYTIVWSTRIGPPSSRGIVEADIVVEDGEWNWWTGGDPATIGASQLDLGAVFIHEAGHYVGLGHAPTTTLCVDQTMYPSISTEDTSKQSLEAGDKAGVEALY